MISSMLDLTLTVNFAAYSQSPLGGSIRNYIGVRIINEPCSFRQLNATETDAYGKTSRVAMYRFYVQYNSGTSAIVIDDRIAFDSRTFEIKAIYNVAGKNEHFQIDCLEVD